MQLRLEAVPEGGVQGAEFAGREHVQFLARKTHFYTIKREERPYTSNSVNFTEKRFCTPNSVKETH